MYKYRIRHWVIDHWELTGLMTKAMVAKVIKSLVQPTIIED